MRKYGILLPVLLVSVLLGCELINPKKPAAKKQPVSGPPAGQVIVAKVGDFYITKSDFAREIDAYNELISRQGLPAAQKVDSKDKKLSYLKEEVVRRYLLFQTAIDRDLDKEENISRMIEQSKINLLVSELAVRETEKISVSSKEIEDWYAQNKERLMTEEQRKVSEIVTPTEAEAKQAYIEVLKGGNFAELAKQFSKGKTASSGGELEFMTNVADPAKMVKFEGFYKAAFSPSLSVGGTSSIISGPDGFYIIKVDEIKKPEALPLNEYWEDIKRMLLVQKQQQAVDSLVDKSSKSTAVEIYADKVD